MYRIPRPKEPGVYELDLFEGDTVERVTFSKGESDSFNIHLASGQVFVIFHADGALTAAVLDLTIPKDHRGH